MAEPDNLLSDRDIDASNVLPAFEASLRFGVAEAELADEIGWRREELERDGATVSGASTYRHMEMLFGRMGYPDFVMAATEGHTLSSLRVVGLACKTAPTVGAAMACHQRYQHLTNRTARYTARIEGDALTLRDDRLGETCLGSRLVADYALFVALQLLRLSGGEVVVRRMRSRRDSMSDVERARYEAFLGAPIELGADAAELVLDASILAAPIASADAELARYLQGVLERAAPSDDEPPILRQVRAAIQEGLLHGTVTAGQVAKQLGLGHRTLQRRLSDLGVRFAQVLDLTRRDLAEGYLARPELSLSEIAYLLGYSEQASFYRAFRRWHEITPAEYREARAAIR